MQTDSPDCTVNLQAGTVTTKNSCSRNLHRLLSSISFISSLLQNLAADKACTLHTATASAYSSTMAPMHNFFVRTAVKGGMYTLPTRAGFLQSIGETGDCTSGIWPTLDPRCLCFCLCVIAPVLYATAWSHEHLVQCPTVLSFVQRKAPEYILPSSSPHQIHLFRKLRRFLLAHQCPSQTPHGQDKLTDKASELSQHASTLLGSQ